MSETSELARDQVSFQDCIERVEELWEDQDEDTAKKHNTIEQLIRKYFAGEEIFDVFEGFLRLLIEFHRFASEINKRSSTSLAVYALQGFHNFVKQSDEMDRDAILESMPEDQEIYIDALKVVGRFRPKHLEQIAFVFRFEDDQKKQKILVPLIRSILGMNEIAIAVEWIIRFNMRDALPFDDVVCNLMLAGQNDLLEAFIGEDKYRRKRLVEFLDKLVGMAQKYFRGHTKLEVLMLEQPKKIEKSAVKYIKLYQLPDSIAPNVSNQRAREYLSFTHHRWMQREISLDNYEETVLEAMRLSEYARRYYLDYLCLHGMERSALFFAISLGLNLETFPKLLHKFCEVHPLEVEKTEQDVRSSTKKKEQNQEIEDQTRCELDNGYPIYVVEDWDAVQKAMDELEDEPVIGIDTEWKPHFCSTKEQIALIQVSSSSAVYLFDVVVLEKRLSAEQWVQYFARLLCSEDTRKIGYDFNNDMRVIRATFPYLSKLLPEVKHVVCLYKLLSQALVMPVASKAIFGVENFTINLSLYEVAKLLLNLELDKSERVGNWIRRPLRLEQKRYAALDAYALVGCFRIIAERLSRLDAKTCSIFEKVSLVKLNEEAKIPVAIDPETGERFASKSKENEKEFIDSIMEVSSAILKTHASAGTKPNSVDDFSFVMDSMLFGLGHKMRKCGFDTHMIGEREKLIRYCEENPDVLAVSAGKAFNQLRLRIPDRVMCVPINTQDVRLNSQLVGYVMRQLDIVVDPSNLTARCSKCNKKAFFDLPPMVVKALFFVWVIQKEMDWVEISKSDAANVLQELRDNAVNTSGGHFTGELQDGEYSFDMCQNQICVKCKGCAVDIMNRLVSGGKDGPIGISMGHVVKRELFEQPGIHFTVCLGCGKIQSTSMETQVAE